MASAGNTVSSFASKTKTKKKHFVAQKVKLFRASDPLLSVLMWGINHSVSQTCNFFLCLCPLLINELEFTRKEKFSRLCLATDNCICWIHALQDHQRSALIFCCLTFSLWNNILFCSLKHLQLHVLKACEPNLSMNC